MTSLFKIHKLWNQALVRSSKLLRRSTYYYIKKTSFCKQLVSIMGMGNDPFSTTIYFICSYQKFLKNHVSNVKHWP